MKRMADHYFKKNEHALAVPEDTSGNNRLTPLERRRNGGEKESKREHHTAAYWGLEKRRSWEEKKLSTISEGKESEKEHLTATYWG